VALALIALIGLLTGTLPAASDQELVYRYVDDFADDAAVDDSILHSVFWSRGAMPADQPHLVYWTLQDEDRAVLFRNYSGAAGPPRICHPRAPWGTRQDRALER